MQRVKKCIVKIVQCFRNLVQTLWQSLPIVLLIHKKDCLTPFVRQSLFLFVWVAYIPAANTVSISASSGLRSTIVPSRSMSRVVGMAVMP